MAMPGARAERRIMRLLGLAGLSAFLLSAFTPLPNLLAARVSVQPELEPAQAIVVLAGGGVSPDGTLSSLSLRRAVHGVLLYEQRLAPLLVLSGGARDQAPTESGLRAELARTLGVPEHAILTESSTRTTREEATRIRALLEPREVHTILLVTDAQHMVRARRLFERAGFEVRAAPANDIGPGVMDPGGRLALLRRTLREVAALLYYRIAGYL
jgi:uncharacterized SAM-binding protein YcdF (DUF218 family)